MKRLVLIVLAMVLVAVPAIADQYTINWTWVAAELNTDGTPITDMGGYVLYYSTVSGPPYPAETLQLGVGNVTSYPWTVEADPGTDGFFNISTYDTNGNSSTYNGEVMISFPLPPESIPLPPTGFTGTLQ